MNSHEPLDPVAEAREHERLLREQPHDHEKLISERAQSFGRNLRRRYIEKVHELLFWDAAQGDSNNAT